MRYITLLLSFLLVSSFLQANDEETIVTSTIKEVKVFLSGAQVSRTSSKKISIGSNTLVFAGHVTAHCRVAATECKLYFFPVFSSAVHHLCLHQ